MKEAVHIVKIGGSLINDKELLSSFISQFIALPDPKILIHGGGRKATELSALLGIETRMVNGRRITDKDTLDVAIMVYAGLINKSIVAMLSSKGLEALGLSGADIDLIRAIKRPKGDIDFGFVGDIIDVNADFLQSILHKRIIPVVCPISHDGNGQLLNTNADTIAAQLGAALAKEYSVQLSYCFEFNGVLYDVDASDLTISSLTEKEVDEMVNQGLINRGMIPKLSNGLEALKNGVDQVTICGINNLSSKKGATILSL